MSSETLATVEGGPGASGAPAGGGGGRHQGGARTEKEKMIAGELYYAFTPQLTAERAAARVLVAEFNAEPDPDRRLAVRRWLGGAGRAHAAISGAGHGARAAQGTLGGCRCTPRKCPPPAE